MCVTRPTEASTRDREASSAGEDVLLDPIALPHVIGKVRFVHGDGSGGTVRRLEQAIHGPEVGVVELQPHGFEHLNADGLVELPDEMPVVLQAQLDEVCHSLPLEELLGIVELLAADGGGGDAAAPGAGGMKGEAAPPVPISRR